MSRLKIFVWLAGRAAAHVHRIQSNVVGASLSVPVGDIHMARGVGRRSRPEIQFVTGQLLEFIKPQFICLKNQQTNVDLQFSVKLSLLFRNRLNINSSHIFLVRPSHTPPSGSPVTTRAASRRHRGVFFEPRRRAVRRSASGVSPLRTSPSPPPGSWRGPGPVPQNRRELRIGIQRTTPRLTGDGPPE